MNIKYESSSEALEFGYDVLVPLIISHEQDSINIEAYDDIADHVECIVSKYGKNFFTKQAIDHINSLLEPYVNSHGYYREISGKYKWYVVLSTNKLSCLNMSYVIPGTEKLSDKHFSYENLTSFDLSELLEKGLSTYVVCENNKLVALASVNEHSPDQINLEITVECSRLYRRKGYALSSVTALTNLLVNQGYSVTYVTSRYNRASLKLAEKAGFKRYGKFYAYTAFKDI